MLSPLGASLAQTEPVSTHVQAARELLDVLQTEKVINGSVEDELKLEFMQNPQLAPLEAIMRQFFTKYASWEYLKDDILHLYTDAFTESELKEISAFYRTKIGQKVLELFPELMGRSMALGNQKAQEHIGELQEMVRKRQKELEQENPKQENQEKPNPK
ncbi:MAG: DUF2059 domain-containing protein [Acidobacteria bacterium]|nr:DUF2059 domain-containing protein [Acidobacteriota bacterium]